MDHTISCNICDSSVDGIAYKTTCFHLLCPVCATKAFTTGQSCPVCSSILQESDIVEIEIGSKQVEKISDILLRHVFKNKDWRAVCDNYGHLIECLNKVFLFVSKQLIQETNNSKRCLQLMSDETHKRDDALENFKQQHNLESHKSQQRVLAFEEELTRRDEELAELKLAYKEKMRKCQAWEKAYNSLRCQLSEGAQLNASLNPATATHHDGAMSEALINSRHNLSSYGAESSKDTSSDMAAYGGGEGGQPSSFRARFTRRTEVTTMRQNPNASNSIFDGGNKTGNAAIDFDGGNNNNVSSSSFSGHKPSTGQIDNRVFDIMTRMPNINSNYNNNSNASSNITNNMSSNGVILGYNPGISAASFDGRSLGYRPMQTSTQAGAGGMSHAIDSHTAVHMHTPFPGAAGSSSSSIQSPMVHAPPGSSASAYSYEYLKGVGFASDQTMVPGRHQPQQGLRVDPALAQMHAGNKNYPGNQQSKPLYNTNPNMNQNQNTANRIQNRNGDYAQGFGKASSTFFTDI